MKVVLVHDYLREYGGAERVLETLHEIFPQAPVFTAYYNPLGLGVNAQHFAGWDIRTSWMQKVPFANKLISPFRIFAPLIFESFDLSAFDVVISSSAVYFAKSVLTQPQTLHIAYIHTPPRFLYGFTTSFNYKKNPLTRILGEIANHFLRLYDFQVSQRPDILVANSENVKKRIKKFYRRDSVVIYPPVDTKLFTTGYLQFAKSQQLKAKSYYLVVSRLVRGKGVEIIIEACGRLGLPLKVAGSGPERESQESRVKSQGWRNIEFLGQVLDSELPKLYAGAKALIVSSEDEDFGITPVEAQAAGTPVIAIKAGGYLETVVEGKTGEFFTPATPKALMEVLENFNSEKYNPEDCRKQAEKFSKVRFKKEILELIEKNIKK